MLIPQFTKLSYVPAERIVDHQIFSPTLYLLSHHHQLKTVVYNTIHLAEIISTFLSAVQELARYYWFVGTYSMSRHYLILVHVV